MRLVLSLERRDSLALVLIQRCAHDSPVLDVDGGVGLLLPGEGVLHPVLVVTVREILTGVGTTGFLADGGGFGGLDGAGEQVAELEGLDEVGVPDHAAVLDADLAEGLVDLVDPVGKKDMLVD
jgi:hypothetical protein